MSARCMSISLLSSALVFAIVLPLQAREKSVKNAQDSISDALDKVDESDKTCRKAVDETLRDAKKALRRLVDEFDAKEARSVLRDLKDALKDAKDDCPKSVARNIGDAIDELSDLMDQAPKANPEPAPLSPDCLELTAMERLAKVTGASNKDIESIVAQRTASCAPGAASGGTFNWPSGTAARYASGEWRYPNGQVYKFASGEYRYANGQVCMFASGEWRYPNGSVAKYANGNRQNLKGLAATTESLVAQVCQKFGSAKCNEWQSWLNNNTGWFNDLAVVEMVWSNLQ